jgi:hypothetical protein
MSQVRLQLANEEAAKTGFSTSTPHSATAFLMLGLDIEDLQCVLFLFINFINIAQSDGSPPTSFRHTLYLDIKEKKSLTAL